MSETPDLSAAEEVLADLFEGGFETVEETESLESDDRLPALSADAFGNLHGPDGKFVSRAEEMQSPAEQAAAAEAPAEEPEAVEEEPVEAVSEEQTEEVEEPGKFDEVVIDDPELVEFLDKYDGDVVKALKAASDAQAVIGRQGNELGDLRNELREQMEQMQQALQQQMRTANVDWDEMIEENPGGAALLAAESGNQQAFIQALNAWYEESPVEATLFMQAGMQAPGQQSEPETASLETEIASLQERHPDLQQHLPAIQELAAERPLMAQALSEGDSRARAQALEDLYLMARSRSTAPTAASRTIILRAKAEADKAVRDAAVESASNASAASAGPSPDDKLAEALRAATGLDDLVVV